MRYLHVEIITGFDQLCNWHKNVSTQLIPLILQDTIDNYFVILKARYENRSFSFFNTIVREFARFCVWVCNHL